MKTLSKKVRTLAETIKEHDAARSRAEVARFRKLPSLRDAIRRAAESKKENGQPYAHQQKNWNFWPDAIGKATKILLKAHDQFSACQDFEEIHELVTELLSNTKGLGPLYCYDVSFRIGANLGNDYLPKKVYLHAGTLEGAKRLGLPTKRSFIEMSMLPKALRTRQPWEVEDILCNYAKCRRRQDRLIGE